MRTAENCLWSVAKCFWRKLLIVQKRDPGILVNGCLKWLAECLLAFRQQGRYCHFVPVQKYDAPKSWVIFVAQVVIFHKGTTKSERAWGKATKMMKRMKHLFFEETKNLWEYCFRREGREESGWDLLRHKGSRKGEQRTLHQPHSTGSKASSMTLVRDWF